MTITAFITYKVIILNSQNKFQQIQLPPKQFKIINKKGGIMINFINKKKMKIFKYKDNKEV